MGSTHRGEIQKMVVGSEVGGLLPIGNRIRRIRILRGAKGRPGRFSAHWVCASLPPREAHGGRGYCSLTIMESTTLTATSIGSM